MDVKTIVDKMRIESTALVYRTMPLYRRNIKKEMAVKPIQKRK